MPEASERPEPTIAVEALSVFGAPSESLQPIARVVSGSIALPRNDSNACRHDARQLPAGMAFAHARTGPTRTWEGNEALIRIHAIPGIGELPLAQIQPPDLQRLYRRLQTLERGLSGGTVLNLCTWS